MNYAKNTQVGIDRSRNEIEKILMRYGASEFGYMRREKYIMVAFRAVNRNIRFIVTAPSPEDFNKTEKGRIRKKEKIFEVLEQATRQRWRALALVIKAKLEAVESGIATFEERILKIIQSETPFSMESVNVAYKVVGSFDVLLSIMDVALKCNVGLVHTADEYRKMKKRKEV